MTFCDLVLIGCPSLVWGVFQAYHSEHFLKGTPDATLSAVGAIQNAVSHSGALY